MKFIWDVLNFTKIRKNLFVDSGSLQRTNDSVLWRVIDRNQQKIIGTYIHGWLESIEVTKKTFGIVDCRNF